MENKNISNQKNTPVGIKAISILNYILGFIGILFAVAAIIGGIYFVINGGSMASQIFGFGSQAGTLGAEINAKTGTFYTYFGFITISIGIVSGILSILAIIIGIKMWKGKNWAKITQIILSVLWAILWSIELFKGAFLNLIMIIPSLIIILYLISSKKVKDFFA